MYSLKNFNRMQNSRETKTDIFALVYHLKKGFSNQKKIFSQDEQVVADAVPRQSRSQK